MFLFVLLPLLPSKEFLCVSWMYVQDEASRWLITLQKELDQSVPAQTLKEAKVQYAQLTAKYRDMLQRESRQSERDSELGKLQVGESNTFHFLHRLKLFELINLESTLC